MREIIKKAMAKGASSCELFYLSSLRTDVDFEANRLKAILNTEERGAALRLIKDGRFGFATSTKLDDPERLADDAIATAAYGDEASFEFAGESAMPEVPIYDTKVAELGVAGMMRRAEDGIARVLDYDREINAESGSQRIVQTISVLTSEGLETSFERTLYSFYIGGRLVEGTNFLNCSSYYGGTALDIALLDHYRTAATTPLAATRNVYLDAGFAGRVADERSFRDLYLLASRLESYGINGQIPPSNCSCCAWSSSACCWVASRSSCIFSRTWAE